MQDRFKFRVWLKELIKPRMTYTNGLSINKNQIDDSDNIVMQCTGLKDKNGKIIYENDIVVEKLTGFKDCVKIVDWIEDTMTGFNLNNEGEYEVIGNIYENPELLEEHNEE